MRNEVVSEAQRRNLNSCDDTEALRRTVAELERLDAVDAHCETLSREAAASRSVAKAVTATAVEATLVREPAA
ncbi:hypothetical protein AB4Y44_06135 [Paraburkholderia sp. BR10937]